MGKIEKSILGFSMMIKDCAWVWDIHTDESTARHKHYPDHARDILVRFPTEMLQLFSVLSIVMPAYQGIWFKNLQCLKAFWPQAVEINSEQSLVPLESKAIVRFLFCHGRLLAK